MIARKALESGVVTSGSWLETIVRPVERVAYWVVAAAVGWATAYSNRWSPALPFLVGLLFILLLLFTSNELAELNGIIPPYGFGYALLFAPRQVANAAFYEVAAQVIAVLFLALAFEQRRLQPEDDASNFMVRGAIVMLLAGGATAFEALISGEGAVDARFVTAPMVGAGIAIGILALLNESASSEA